MGHHGNLRAHGTDAGRASYAAAAAAGSSGIPCAAAGNADSDHERAGTHPDAGHGQGQSGRGCDEPPAEAGSERRVEPVQRSERDEASR